MPTQYEIPDKYQKDIEIATNLLQKEGCHSIYLFGSMVTGNIMRDQTLTSESKDYHERNFSKLEPKYSWKLKARLILLTSILIMTSLLCLRVLER